MPRRRITDERLIAYASGELCGDEAVEIEAFLAGNPDAARRVASWRLVGTTRAEDDSIAPPAETVARARGIFRAPAPDRKPSLLERLDAVMARIVYDSRLQPATVRYDDGGSRFQLSYETDDLDIDVRAERTTLVPEPRWRLMGQVESDAALPPVRASLHAAGSTKPVVTCEADGDGVFGLDAPAGVFELHLAVGANHVVLPQIEIR